MDKAEYTASLVAKYIPAEMTDEWLEQFAPGGIELHLKTDPDFPKRFGKRVKALGGRYDECRGNAHKRYVVVPLDGPLPRQQDVAALVDEMVAAFGWAVNNTVIVRGVRLVGGAPQHVFHLSGTGIVEQAIKRYNDGVRGAKHVHEEIARKFRDRESAARGEREAPLRALVVSLRNALKAYEAVNTANTEFVVASDALNLKHALMRAEAEFLAAHGRKCEE